MTRSKQDPSFIARKLPPSIAAKQMLVSASNTLPPVAAHGATKKVQLCAEHNVPNCLTQSKTSSSLSSMLIIASFGSTTVRVFKSDCTHRWKCIDFKCLWTSASGNIDPLKAQKFESKLLVSLATLVPGNIALDPSALFCATPFGECMVSCNEKSHANVSFSPDCNKISRHVSPGVTGTKPSDMDAFSRTLRPPLLLLLLLFVVVPFSFSTPLAPFLPNPPNREKSHDKHAFKSRKLAKKHSSSLPNFTIFPPSTINTSLAMFPACEKKWIKTSFSSASRTRS